MMIRKKSLFAYCIIAAAILSPLFLPSEDCFPQDKIRLVQSIPLETEIGKSEIENTIDVWLEIVGNAKRTIDIETFYFADQDNSPLNEFMASLKSAAGRGVNVRIIVDSSFYSSNDKSVDLLEGVPNIEIRKIAMRNIAGGVMHAKFFIVDNETVFAGSQNMDWRALIHIHEIGAVVTDKKLAETFTEIFETDWKLCEGNLSGITAMRVNLFVNRENPVVLSDSESGDVEIYPAVSPYEYSMSSLSYELDELLRLINESKQKLNIQVYSYSVKDKSSGGFYAIDSALRNAAARGVKIRMIIPDWAAKPSAIDAIKELSLVENIQLKISSIPLYSGGFIPYARVDHSKFFTADDEMSWISTTNWEKNYFYNSRNVSFVVKSKEINKKLSGVFELWWNSPYSEFIDVNKQYEEVKRK